MENAFDELRRALNQAREVNRVIDQQVNALFDLIDGRLELMSPYRLRKLKKQLQGFNAVTGTWKD